MRRNSLKPLLEIKLVTENEMTQQRKRCNLLIGYLFQQKSIQTWRSLVQMQMGHHPSQPHTDTHPLLHPDAVLAVLRGCSLSIFDG